MPIDWDRERGHHDGYVGGRIRFAIDYVHPEQEWEAGSWLARDLQPRHGGTDECRGDYDACVRWCEGRVEG